jgi:hypothetical protein
VFACSPSRDLTEPLINQTLGRYGSAYTPRMEPKRSLDEPFWMKRSDWLFLAVVALVSLVGYGTDRVLSREGLSRVDLLWLGDVVTGIVAGSLFLYVARREKVRRDRMAERMRTVAELNHHIRNALQVIKLAGAQPSSSSFDDRQLQLIKESADRIEWALREVLPRYPAAESLRQQPTIGFAAVPSPASHLKAFASRRQEDRLH